jgi:photosystem II stability/assembly factor-like uncharacterized protein
VDIVNATTGYIGASAGDIYKTTDGGATWKHLLAGTRGVQVPKVCGCHTGWSVGDYDVYKTTDGGNTWLAQYIGTTKAV